ncbi:DinB family protein [Deinococcus radiophilus]|uniref:DinB family protein n=1 Tax=Deinococcus radiophilus TaxID=32062 RepID=A0A431VQV3_9DEIO|nr:DinB family protein [Deinococcus radiophilus]RTR25555.1 DinB family protein [Deinococcus radiophilus]UFA50499.1 DinB family protein [Deinococcus radiophilus]
MTSADPAPDERAQASTLAFARLLPKLFRGGQAFLSVEAVISDLSAEQATQRPDALPHSAAQLLDHVNWWNRWMLDILESGQAQEYPEHASDTWREVGPEDWSGIKTDFYDLLARIDAHAARPDLASPVNHDETVGELLADFALHTAHHFGQMVTVRQSIGAWPPAGGGDTW